MANRSLFRDILRKTGVGGLLAATCLTANAALPDDVKFTITAGGGTQTLNLHKRTARTNDFAVRTWDSANGYVVVSPTPEVRTYRGTVDENPNAIVIASIDANNVLSVYCFDRVYSHNTLWQASANVTSQLVSPATPAPMPTQTVAAPRNGSTGPALIGPKVPTGTAANGVKYGEMVEFEMAMDIFVGSYNASGQNIDTALANYELLAMVFEQMMARDLLVRVVLPTVVIRKETHSVQGGLGALRAEWVKAPLKNLRWDNVWGSEGGVAQSSQIGKDENSVALGALYHECAHNWGASHLVYQCDTMGGNKPSIGPITIEKMRAKRQEAINENKLPQAQPYTDPLAPFTHVDIARINMDTATDIDVLANDMDANGDVLTVSDFTTTTVPGGTVTLNPNGTLHYVPPANFVGKDVIIYTAQDNSTMGLKTREVVHIDVVNNDLTARYTFDETTGTSAANAVPNAPPATLNGSNFASDSVPSPLGRGVRANGTQDDNAIENGSWSGILLGNRNVMPTTLYSSDYGRVTPFETEYNDDGNGYDPMNGNYTFSTWFRSDNYNTGAYIASKWWHPETSVGWDMRIASNQLQLHWRIFQGSQGIQTLTAPAYAYIPGKWYHVASVFDRATGQIRLYLNGVNVATKSGAFPSNGVVFNGRAPLALGCFSNKNYCFDDTRIYTKALTTADVQDLFEAPGAAPRFLSSSIAFTTYVNFAINKTNLWSSIWSGSTGTVSFSKVSGPGWMNVDSGGNLTGTPGTADVGVSTAIIRITDGVGATADLTVNLTVANPLLRARWHFDENTGTAAADSSGNGKTATLVGATWGTAPREGASNLDTNGTSSQYAQATSLNTTGGFTISAWIKPATVSGLHSFISQNGSYVFKTSGAGLVLTTPGKADHFSSGLTLAANTWQHVMVSFKPSTSGGVKFYLNGVLKSSANASALSQNSNVTTIGKTTQYGAQDFSGGIDDVRVYGVAMGDGEAMSIYSQYSGNNAPIFTSHPISGARATENIPYSGNLSAGDPDAGDVLVYSKAGGPAWLTVAPDGTLSGTPGADDVGDHDFTVLVTDAGGKTDTSVLEIYVAPYLLAHWKLDEGSGALAADSSGLEKDATVVGATWSLARVGGSSLTTNGTASQYASAPSLDTTGGFTLSAWIKPGTVSGNHAVISQQNSYVLRTVGTALYLTTPGVTDHISSGITLVANQWQHVAVTFKPGAVGGAKFFLNGVLKNSVNASALSQSTFPTLLGRTNNFTSQDYNGAMDDVRVYGTPLDPADVENLYLSYPDYTAPAFTSDPIAGAVTAVGVPYASSLAGSAVDTDDGAELTYSKVSGPAWLTVAADGSFTGTPGSGNVGANAFVVRVTDETLQTDNATLNITVVGNAIPVFSANPITGGGATEDSAYYGSIASYGSDTDVGDTITFSKVSGPAWLNVAANGTLSGTPGNEDVGANSFTVKVTDTPGASTTATLTINVTNVNDAPVFSANPIMGSPVVVNTSYTGTIATYGADIDVGDTLTYSKVSGPSWLAVASNGALSGTPLTANLGINAFVVKVTDIAGANTNATFNVTVDFPANNGTWTNLAGGSWITPANWSGSLIANGPDKTANFSTLNLTANATVPLNGARTIGNLSFSDTTASHNWTLATGTGGPLTLDVTTGSPTITVTNGTATLSAPLAGSDGLTKSGVGTLALTGPNTYTGTTTITQGILSFASGSLGTSGAITLNGGTLQWNGTNTQDISSRLAMVTATAATLDTNGNNVTLASAIGGGTSGSLVKAGAGTLTLSGANTYTGVTTLNGGTLALSGNNRLASTGTVSFGGSATLNVGGSQTLASLTSGVGSFTEAINSGGGSINVTGTGPFYIANGTNGTTQTSTLTITGTTVSFPGTSTFHVANQTGSSNATSIGTLTLNSGGTLNAGNLTLAYMDYTGGAGSASAGGTITINNGGTLAAKTVTMQTADHQNGLHSGAITLNSGGTFLLGTLSAGSSVSTTFSNTITFNGGTLKNYDASTNLLINTLIGTTHTLVLGTSGTPTFDIGAGRTGTINEVMSGSGSLTKIGAGSLILGAANTYTGLTTVSEGTLTAAVANALGSSGITIDNAIYSLGTFSDSVGNVTLDGGGQITSSTGVLTSTGTFEMKNGSVSAILAGSGAGLNKTTVGTVVLTRANTYTGATNISEGTLSLTGSLAATATTVQTDATLGGTGTIGGTVTILDGGTLAPGVNAIGTLTVNNTLTLAGSTRMEIAKTGATLTADKLTGISTVIYGGTLEVDALGPDTLAVGDSFQLFSATTYAGAFDYLDLPELPSGLVWRTSSLLVDGTISVGAIPIAVDNSYTLAEDSVGTFSVMGNDSDANSDTLALDSVTQGLHGSVAISGDDVIYTPAANYVGTDSFTYTITDGIDGTATATVSVTVTNTNDAPSFTASPITGSGATEDTAYTASIASYGADIDAGDAVTYSKFSGPAWLSVASNGAITGTPLNADVGTNSFTVKVTDIAGAFATATLDIDVANTNDAPVFSTGTITGSGATEDTAYSASIASYGSDIDAGDAVTYSKVNGPAWLSVASNGAITGTPLNADVGTNSFTVKVTDIAGAFATATLDISVTNTNDAPVFTSDPFASSGAYSGIAYSDSVAGAAGDVDTGDTRTFSKVSGPAWLSVASNGSLSGTPSGSDAGTNSFTVRVTDAASASTDATLEIDVTIPAANGTWTDLTGGSWTDNGNWSGSVIANGSGNTANFATLNLTANATVTLDGARTIGNLSFSDTTASHNWTLASGSGGPLTLDVASGSPQITVTNGTATLGVVLAGADGATKTGPGILALTAANSYSGITHVHQGTVNVTGNQSAADGGWNIAPLAGENVLTRTVNFNSGSTIAVASGKTFQLGYTSPTGAAAVLNVAGTVSNDGALNVQRSALLTISSGGVWTQSGSLLIASNASGGGPTMTVASGGSFTYDNSNTSLITINATNNGGTSTLNIAGTFITNQGFTETATGTGAATISLNGGTLKLSADVPVLTATAGSTFNFVVGTGGGIIDTNGYSTTMSRVISGSTGLSKNGTGTLTLGAANTYTGATTVNGGTFSLTGSLAATAVTVKTSATLSGTGTTAGAVTVQSGGTLAPGVNGTGTLTVNNTLSLAGTASLEIGRNGSVLSGDKVSGITTLTRGGTLTVTNTGADPLLAGNSFRLFSATTYSGSFATITLPSLDTGLSWDMTRLALDGTLVVVGTQAPGWTSADIGSPGIGGGTNYASNTYSVTGGGADIWGTSDAFHLTSTTLTGDGEIRARITSQTAPNSAAKAGVMMRNTSAANSANVLMAITPGSGFLSQSRATAGGTSSSTAGSSANSVPNNWVRITRSGSLFTTYASADGVAWTQVGQVTVTMGSSISVGLAVTAHDNAQIGTATFDNVAVTPYPSPWVTADIGTTGLTGRSEYFNAIHTLNGAGVVGSTADGLRYTYQTLSADGEITARIPAFANTGTSSRIGVMIRDTLSSGSSEIFLGTDGSGAFTWTRRTSTGGSTTTSNSGTATSPNVWVRLTRVGTSITAYSSVDGSTWTTIGSTTVTMASNCYIGLAVGSGNTSGLNTSSFDNVSVTP